MINYRQFDREQPEKTLELDLSIKSESFNFESLEKLPEDVLKVGTSNLRESYMLEAEKIGQINQSITL